MTVKNIAGVLFVILALALAGGGLYGAQHFKQPKFDPDNLCAFSGPSAATIIIVDKTDRLSSNELQRVQEIIGKERKALAPGAKIVISILEQIEDRQVSARTVLSLCNPGSEANPLFENPKRVLARYNESFLEPLEIAMRKVSSEGSAPSSPIAEAINSALNDKAMASAHKGKLVLFSEHTKQGSAYDGSFTLATLQQLISPQALTRLRQFTIQVALQPRPQYERRQSAAKAIWIRFFKDATGADPLVLAQ